MWSRLLGSLDVGYYWIRSLLSPTTGSERNLFFKNGFGDLEQAEANERESIARSAQGDLPFVEDSLEWEELECGGEQDGGGTADSSGVGAPSGAAPPPVGTRTEGVAVSVGRFQSPLAPRLPDECKRALFHYVRPTTSDPTASRTPAAVTPPRVVGRARPQSRRATAQDAPLPHRMCENVTVLFLPATGEEGADNRLPLAERFALEYGWSSVLITAPFHGARRARGCGQTSHHAVTVEHFLDQTTAIIMEAAMMGCWAARARGGCGGARRSEQNSSNGTPEAGRLRSSVGAVNENDGENENDKTSHLTPSTQKTPKQVLCFTGYSWGGAMCSLAALTSLFLVDADEVAVTTAPYAGSATPLVVADGLLVDDIDWPALCGNDSAQEAQREALERVRAILRKRNTRNVVADFRSAAGTRGNAQRGNAERGLRRAVEGENRLGSAATPGGPGVEGEDPEDPIDLQDVDVKLPSLAAVECVSFADDHFVKPEFGEELFDILKEWVGEDSGSAGTPRAKLTWRNGGHVSAHFGRNSVQRDAVVRAVATGMTH